MIKNIIKDPKGFFNFILTICGVKKGMIVKAYHLENDNLIETGENKKEIKNMNQEKQLIGIVKSETITLYFDDNTTTIVEFTDIDLSDEDMIDYYSKYHKVLERDQKIKNAVNSIK